MDRPPLARYDIDERIGRLGRRGQAVRRSGFGQERRDRRIAGEHQVVSVVDDAAERLVVERAAPPAGPPRGLVQRRGMAEPREPEGCR